MEDVAVFKNYQSYLISDVWRQKRERVIERDGHQCRYCMADAPLDVHHKSYRYIYKERIEDLLTLCRKCHKNLHRLIQENSFEHIQDKPLTDSFIKNSFIHPLFQTTGERIKEKLRRYNKENPKFYLVFAYHAGFFRKLYEAYPAKTIIERLRSDYDLDPHVGKLQFDNSLTAPYARLLAIENEAFYAFFKFRFPKNPTDAQIEYKKFMDSLYYNES